MQNTLQYSRSNTEEDVGKQFIDFHRAFEYQEIPSSSLLDDSVPMSFVMSAGMVQFERLSSGRRRGDHFVLIQNCFRYFDLEQIGQSTVHLSLFRMPGAFDFGPVDHLKTISRIWELLTGIYGFDPGSLFATYFCGDLIDGQPFPADMETAMAWSKVGLPSEHVIGLPARYNFWQQSREVVGPQNSRKRGPNSEVFFDRGAQTGCGAKCFPGCPCGRFLEFSNTLFITHGLDESTGLLAPLPEPFTEVVIGLERVTSILQGRESVFEIDNIYPLIQQVRCFSKPLPVELKDIDPFKLECTIVDHLRALLFLVADGAPPPGKGGRARLIRILIRELLTSQRLLGISDRGFLRSLTQTILEFYPRLAPARNRLLAYMIMETERFEHTIEIGIADLETIFDQLDHAIRLDDIASMGKELGLPPVLVRYQFWQKMGMVPAFDESNSAIK